MNRIEWIFTAFFLKHFVCDFPLQRPYQFLNKGIYGHPGGLLHAAIHGFGTGIVCMGFGLPPWLALADFAIHYHFDWAKARVNDHWRLTPESGESYWWLLGLDQLAHYLTYAGLVAIGT